MNLKQNEDPVHDPSTNASRNQFLIVGIGASAGGVQALRTFFRQVSPDSGMVYVVILHLSPEFDSRLAEVLQPDSAIPVTQIRDEKVKVEPNRAYVIPPNRSLTMMDGYLELSSRESFEERRAPIDIFFRTLADSNDGRSIAVILSGTGSDGSMGIKRIKENGGIVLVQHPDEAQFNDMPRNAIAQGLADFVLPVEQIPSQILHYREKRKNIHIAARKEEDAREEEHEHALRDIFTQIRVKTGHDFSNYKRATILRRIERRMNVRESADLLAYASLIRNEKEEPMLLLKDLLISVTNFFRDKESFETLEREIIPKIFAQKNARDVVRIWVAACATGEEAYSIAILCAEKLSGLTDPPVVQIFATDIDGRALAVSREGFYSNADVADVSPERLRRFFLKEGTGFRIKRELREMILFARHNILKDPPFSRLDLATCRNLLIYLNRSAQDRVIETFHFALNPGRYLFLGSSETIDGNSNLFATINREHSLFQSRAVVSPTITPLPEPLLLTKATDLKDILAPATEQKPVDRISIAGLHHQLLELYASPSILVNAQHEIIHVSKNAGQYLQIAGEPSLNLLGVVRPELRLELRGALYSATQSAAPVHVHGIKVNMAGREEFVDITVKPVLGTVEAARGFLLVFFDPSATAPENPGRSFSVNAASEPITLHLEEELMQIRSQFRQLAEQYEVQTEEFKASNEELQAINEELRSSAEELETSKEELQSVNEELTTVNQELKVKIEELSQTNNDFKNLINATHIGTIFLDRSFSVNLFTPAASQIFNLKPADYGRPLSDITSRLNNFNVMPVLEKVMDTLQPDETEVSTEDGKTYLMRTLPYRTAEDYINGVILTFIDISARKKAEDAVRSSEEQMRALFSQSRAGGAQISFNGTFTMVNERFYKMLGYSEHELLGKKVEDFIAAEDRDQYVHLFRQLTETKKPFEKEQRYICRNGNTLWLHNSSSLVYDSSGKPQSVISIVINVNDQKLLEQQKDEFMAIASHELKTPMTSIKSYVEILQDRFKKKGDDASEKIVIKLGAQIDRMVTLIQELLDSTAITKGTFGIQKQQCDLNALVEEVIDNLRYITPEFSIELDQQPLPPYNCDRSRIEQVLVNFVDNAVKYAPDTERIIVSTAMQHGQIRICVEDFGNGVPENIRKEIFHRFYRGHGDINSGSLGLGLYIAMEIAKLHGGTIEVNSSENTGAKFCLILPALNSKDHE